MCGMMYNRTFPDHKNKMYESVLYNRYCNGPVDMDFYKLVSIHPWCSIVNNKEVPLLVDDCWLLFVLDSVLARYYYPQFQAEIRQIYYCKSYLNVQRISDLCTADGVFVLPSIAKGERSIRQCTSKLGEIRQERPSGNTWTIWRRFLATICGRNKGITMKKTMTLNTDLE